MCKFGEFDFAGDHIGKGVSLSSGSVRRLDSPRIPTDMRPANPMFESYTEPGKPDMGSYPTPAFVAETANRKQGRFVGSRPAKLPFR